MRHGAFPWSGRPTLRPVGHWRDAALHGRIETRGPALMPGPSTPGQTAASAPEDPVARGWLCLGPDGAPGLADRAVAAAFALTALPVSDCMQMA